MPRIDVHCPYATARIFGHTLDAVFAQAVNIAGIVAERGKIAPLRWQLRQAAIRRSEPQAAFAIAQGIEYFLARQAARHPGILRIDVNTSIAGQMV